MGHDADVFIVGGGPAGLAAAIAACGKGLRVVVADGREPPISKTCGEGLLADAVLALRKLGVALSAADGRVLRGINFQDEDSSVQAEFRGGLGVGVRREVLHQRMVERAEESGVSFCWGTPVTGLWDGGVVAGGNKIRARWVIGADGDRSRVRRWAGFANGEGPAGRFAWREHYHAKPWSDFAEVHWDSEAQAYVTPTAPEEICVALISGQRKMPSLESFPRLARKLEQATPVFSGRGALTRVGARCNPVRGNVALIGDASGSVDAISAEGLSLAFRQALVLADALQMGDLRHYEIEHRRLLRRPRFMSRVMLFLAHRPALRRRTFQAMAAAPNIFDCMLAYHVGEAKTLELAATGAQFSWRFLTA